MKPIDEELKELFNIYDVNVLWFKQGEMRLELVGYGEITLYAGQAEEE